MIKTTDDYLRSKPENYEYGVYVEELHVHEFLREYAAIKIQEFAEMFVANTDTAYKQKDIQDWIKQNLI